MAIAVWKHRPRSPICWFWTQLFFFYIQTEQKLFAVAHLHSQWQKHFTCLPLLFFRAVLQCTLPAHCWYFARLHQFQPFYFKHFKRSLQLPKKMTGADFNWVKCIHKRLQKQSAVYSKISKSDL